MKFHRNLAVAILEALFAIFNEKRYADKVLEHLLKSNPRWGSKDRGFIAETTYEIVRNWRLCVECSSLRYKDDADLYSDSNFWEILGTYWTLNEQQLPSWEEFERIVPEKIIAKYEKLSQKAISYYSIPDWLQELATTQLGEQWEKELPALSEPAKVVLRANSLKVTSKALSEQLLSENIGTYNVPATQNALVLKERQNIFKSPLFKQGLFEIQDVGSQVISEFLNVKPQMRVIDACAGAGGKTLHLAALMENKGRIIALDVEQRKLDELKKRARRAGVAIVESRLVENSKTIKRLANSADRLLLDVPCSGLGVLKRNPDAKWKLSKTFIEEVEKTQYEILSSYSQMLKVGGRMVYSTCSILPSENEKQIEKFIKEQDGKFKFINQRYLMPSQYGFDGFFMAALERI